MQAENEKERISERNRKLLHRRNQYRKLHGERNTSEAWPEEAHM